MIGCGHGDDSALRCNVTMNNDVGPNRVFAVFALNEGNDQHRRRVRGSPISGPPPIDARHGLG